MTRNRSALWGFVAGLALSAASASLALAEGELTFGSQWWDQTSPEAKYREFRDIPQGGFLESFYFREWGGRNMVTLYGSNGFREDQAASLSWMNGARMRVDLKYTEVPHNFSFVSRSPYVQTAPGVLALPDSLQRTIQENPSTAYRSILTDLMNNAPHQNLAFRTDLTRARLRLRPAAGWAFEMKGTRRERAGNKAFAASFGFSNSFEVYEPIDQRMIEADGRLSYSRNRFTVQGSAGVSTFENYVDSLRVDNPKRYTDRVGGDGAAAGTLDLYPDNRQVRGNLAVAYQLPKRTIATATVGLSRNTQNDRWHGYTSNRVIPEAGLDSLAPPGSGTDARVTSLFQDYRVTTHPDPMLGATLRYRQNWYNASRLLGKKLNRTEEHEFPGRVNYDASWAAGPWESHVLENRTIQYGLDADFMPIPELTIAGTIEQIVRERNHREIERDEETAYSLQARGRPGEGVEISARFRRGDREADEFLYEDYENRTGTAYLDQPGLRRFDVANRIQEKADGSVSWTPDDRITVSGSFSYLSNDYTDHIDFVEFRALHNDTTGSQFGLRTEKSHRVSAAASYRPNERMELSGGYGWGQIETDQHSRTSSTAVLARNDSTNWRARIKDWSGYVYGNASWWARPEKLQFLAGYEFDRSPGTYKLTDFLNTAKDLPGTRYKRQAVSLEGRYQVLSHTRIGARWSWEEYNLTDFAAENISLVGVTGTSVTAIYLGDNLLDYKAHRLGLLVTRTF